MALMAVNADEKWLVVGLDQATLSVYSLPGGELVRTFGGLGDGPLQFMGLRRLCFAPNSNLIAVDFGNRRLQEVTLEGVFVRFVGVGSLVIGIPHVLRCMMTSSLWGVLRVRVVGLCCLTLALAQ